MSRQRHWKNYGVGGEISFVTATALDFVHVFANETCREAMRESLLADCRHYGIALHAFVVMPHHIHLLMRPPEKLTASAAMQRLKKNSARRIRPLLDVDTLTRLQVQSGLNRRTFWKDSFRSVPVLNSRVFWQKANYIHHNPVRAEYVANALDYRWSSAAAFERGAWSEERGLDLDDLL